MSDQKSPQPNIPQGQQPNIQPETLRRKFSLSVWTAVLIIVVGGGYLIADYYENKTTKPANQETENY